MGSFTGGKLFSGGGTIATTVTASFTDDCVVSDAFSPPTSGLLDTKGGTAVRGLALPHLARLSASLKEVINNFDLFPRQWPLSSNTVLRTWHEIYLVPDASIYRQLAWDLSIQEDARKLMQDVIIRILFLQRIPALRLKALDLVGLGKYIFIHR